MNNWYPKISCCGQGLVIEEITGATIAVSYDPIHTNLIAAAPEMLSTLKDISLALTNGRIKKPLQWLNSINSVISKAEEGNSDG